MIYLLSHRKLIILLNYDFLSLKHLNSLKNLLIIVMIRTMSQIAANYGVVAKFSEAGCGDCSVGVCFESKIAKKVIDE
jgi:mevalonate kinase